MPCPDDTGRQNPASAARPARGIAFPEDHDA